MKKGVWKEQAFQQQMSTERDFPLGTPIRFKYIICCGHRTGSNLLGEALYQSGMAGDPMEYFNQRFLRALAASRNSPGLDIDQYLQEMKTRRTSPNGVFGINVKFDQLHVLFKDNWPAVTGLIRDQDLVVFLFRRDKIRQAISLHVAQSRDLYNVPADASDHEVRELVESVPFDLQNISNCLNSCIHMDQAWLSFFKQNGIRFEPLAYEDLITNYETTIGYLLGKFGVTDTEQSIPSQPLKKVGNQVNDAFRSRFLAYICGTADP